MGSTLALLLSSWYHKRMLERRRKNKHYDIVPGDDDVEGGEADGERDLELGEGVGASAAAGLGDQETGTVQAGAGAEQHTNVTEELNTWDENAEDWEEEEPPSTGGSGEGQKTPTSSTDDGTMDTRKRAD